MFKLLTYKMKDTYHENDKLENVAVNKWQYSLLYKSKI